MSNYPHTERGEPDHDSALEATGITDADAFCLDEAWYRYEEHYEEHVFVQRLDQAALNRGGPLSSYDVWNDYRKGNIETASQFVPSDGSKDSSNRVVIRCRDSQRMALDIDDVPDEAVPEIDFCNGRPALHIFAKGNEDPVVVLDLPTDSKDLVVQDQSKNRSSLG